MKNKTTKKLLVSIVTLFMFTSFTADLRAQQCHLVTCNCTAARYGCPIGSILCAACCIKKCKVGRMSIPIGSKETSSSESESNQLSNSTIISFSVAHFGKVTLKLFDLNGNLISILVEDNFKPGENEVVWNARDVNAGVYFLKYQTSDYIQTEKLIVMK